MKALDKEQEKKKGELVDAIRSAHAELETAIKAFNETVETAKDEVQGKLNTLNEKITEAGEWTESIASDMDSYYEEKSERWQEGEKGQEYSAWKEEYENFSADSVDVDFPDDIEVPDCTVGDDLENLPDEP